MLTVSLSPLSILFISCINIFSATIVMTGQIRDERRQGHDKERGEVRNHNHFRNDDDRHRKRFRRDDRRDYGGGRDRDRYDNRRDDRRDYKDDRRDSYGRDGRY